MEKRRYGSSKNTGKESSSGYDKNPRQGRYGKPSGDNSSVRLDKGEGTSRGEKPGKPQRPERPERPWRGGKTGAGGKPVQGGRPGQGGKPAYGGKQQPDEKPISAKFSGSRHMSGREEINNFDRTDEFDRADDLDKLEGRNSVLEALKAGRSINKILVAKGDREGSVTQIVAIARQNRIVVQEVDRAKLDSLSSTHAHQGVIAFAAAKDYVEVDEILEAAEASGRPPFIVILDEITDAYNLGSILRTANAAGVHGVIIPKRRAIGLTAAVSKASAGAMEYVPVARVTNIAQTIEQLKKKNIWVVGTDSTGEKPFFKSDLTGPIALVVGSEGEGMGKLVRESCDFTVNIPMLGDISSLNAAVAGAIVMYEILKQRSK